MGRPDLQQAVATLGEASRALAAIEAAFVAAHAAAYRSTGRLPTIEAAAEFRRAVDRLAVGLGLPGQGPRPRPEDVDTFLAVWGPRVAATAPDTGPPAA